MIAGRPYVRRFLPLLGEQRFTLVANVAMAANFGCKCLSDARRKAWYYLAMGPYVVGSNRMLAVDAQATAEASAVGMGKGETQAAKQNCLAVVSIVAPQVYAALYEGYGANATFACGAACTLLSQLPLTMAMAPR